jgi:hypothetical protein
MNLSQFGIKIRSAGDVRAGAAAKLAFTPPDGGSPIHVMSLLVREDYDGYAFHFVNLTGGEFQRLAALADRLA